jgi:hypothetical protein
MSIVQRSVVAAALLASSLVAQQPNLPAASLHVNGRQGPPFPIVGVSLPRGLTVQVEFGGTPGAPFVLAGSSGLAAAATLLLGGSLDLDPTGLHIALDGTRDPHWSVPPVGPFAVGFLLPASVPVGTRAAFQAAVADPGAPQGATLTAAIEVTVTPGIAALPLSLGNDAFAAVDLSPYAMTLPFYDRVYGSFFVNANGSVSFGVGSNDFSPTVLEFLAWMPRIAGYWADLDPSAGGQVTVTVDQVVPPGFVEVAWTAVPHIAGPAHDFRIRIDADPLACVAITQGVFGSTVANVMVGITPGGNLGSAPTKDLSALFATPVTGSPNENFHEGFGPPGTTGTAFNNPFDLFGRTVTFTGILAGSTGASYVGSATP